MVVALLSSFSGWGYKARLLPSEFYIQRSIKLPTSFQLRVRSNGANPIPPKSVIHFLSLMAPALKSAFVSDPVNLPAGSLTQGSPDFTPSHIRLFPHTISSRTACSETSGITSIVHRREEVFLPKRTAVPLSATEPEMTRDMLVEIHWGEFVRLCSGVRSVSPSYDTKNQRPNGL